jgi:hypothetical protein
MPFMYVLIIPSTVCSVKLTQSLTQTKIYCLGMLITLNLRAAPSGSSTNNNTTGGLHVAYTVDAVTTIVSPPFSRSTHLKELQLIVADRHIPHVGYVRGREGQSARLRDQGRRRP